MSGIYTQKIELVSSDVDANRRLRMSALFRFLQEISIAHTERLGAGRAKTLDRGALWVMTRMYVRLARSPVYGERLTLESWPGETMHLLFPRGYRLLSQSGERLGEASGLWALIDAVERRMLFPSELGIELEGVSVEGELPPPGALAPFEADVSEVRDVRYSDIDLNAHVNNTRYLDWFDDLFDEQFHRAHRWRELQINYQSEIAPRARVELRRGESERNVYRAEGVVGDTAAFTLRAVCEKIE